MTDDLPDPPALPDDAPPSARYVAHLLVCVDRPLTTTEVVEATGLPRSTVREVVTAFKSAEQFSVGLEPRPNPVYEFRIEST